MYPLIDLTGKRIVVVGASQGIGRQTAITLSEGGAKCAIVARNEAKLLETISLMEGEGHCCYVLDVSQNENIEACAKQIVAEFGPVDGLVYAAGVTNDRALNMLKPAVVDDTIHTNLGGFLEFTRCLTKKKAFNPGMRIVGIASTAALRGGRAQTIYSATKAGMLGAVRCLANELAEKEICVNCVAPSMIRTAMYDKWVQDNGGNEAELSKEKQKRQYLGIGETTDVANAIAF